MQKGCEGRRASTVIAALHRRLLLHDWHPKRLENGGMSLERKSFDEGSSDPTALRVACVAIADAPAQLFPV